MTLAVATAVEYDGLRNATILLTGSGGSLDSETGVVKVNVASLNPVASQVKVWEIEYDTEGIAVQILWDATVPVLLAIVQGCGRLDFYHIGGAPNPKPPGVTGNILFSTVKPSGGGGNMEGIVDNQMGADLARGAVFSDELDRLRTDTSALWSYKVKLRLKKTGIITDPLPVRPKLVVVASGPAGRLALEGDQSGFLLLEGDQSGYLFLEAA